VLSKAQPFSLKIQPRAINVSCLFLSGNTAPFGSSASAACKNLDLPPVNLRFLPLHLTKNAFVIALPHACGIALVFMTKSLYEIKKKIYNKRGVFF